jgi:hypothetical protein
MCGFEVKLTSSHLFEFLITFPLDVYRESVPIKENIIAKESSLLSEAKTIRSLWQAQKCEAKAKATRGGEKQDERTEGDDG